MQKPMTGINQIAPLAPAPGLRRQDPRRRPDPRQDDDEPSGEGRDRRPPRDGEGRIDEYV